MTDRLTVAIAWCEDGIDCTLDHSSPGFQLVSTTVRLSARSANTVYERNSEKLIQVSNLSTPYPEFISPGDLLSVSDKLFGGSIGANSLSWINLILGQLAGQGGGTPDLETFLRKFLTWPIVWFQANTGPVEGSLQIPLDGLPRNLYVTAAIAQNKSRSQISFWTAVVFTSVAGGVILWCIAALVWSMKTPVPEHSPFPLMDFAMIFNEDEVAGGGNRPMVSKEVRDHYQTRRLSKIIIR